MACAGCRRLAGPQSDSTSVIPPLPLGEVGATATLLLRVRVEVTTNPATFTPPSPDGEGKSRHLVGDFHMFKTFFLVISSILLTTISLSAHHGTAASYDSTRSLTLTGTVTEFVFSNPHAQLYFDVKDT